MDAFLNEVCLRIGRWALTSKERQNLNLDSVLHNLEACLDCGPIKERADQIIFPPMGSLKFNVNGATKGKPGLLGIRGVCHNSKSQIL